MFQVSLKKMLILLLTAGAASVANGQANLKMKYSNSSVFSGIEVGSKGVKMSLVEIGRNARLNGSFNILKDTSVNTDFISFNELTFSATLDAFCGLYRSAQEEFNIPGDRIFTAISSGVKSQAEKDDKNANVQELIDSFKTRIREPERDVTVIDVKQEALLSHVGIVPESRRYTTFLIDIGSGNTKGGYFPYGNTSYFYLFQLNWGTKSTANAAEKTLDNKEDMDRYQRSLGRILAGAEQHDIIYAVNASGAYPLTDYIAFSGGIAWASATLMKPELVNNAVISVTYDEVEKYAERLSTNFGAYSPSYLAGVTTDEQDQASIVKTATTIHKVFDQRSLMAGAGLMLKIMRQFHSIYETKKFYLVKNGQVGWISAFVDESISD